jgi:hypothetical protein
MAVENQGSHEVPDLFMRGWSSKMIRTELGPPHWRQGSPRSWQLGWVIKVEARPHVTHELVLRRLTKVA